MKVNFNIKKLLMRKIVSYDEYDLPVYGDKLPVPGTVSLVLDNEQTSEPFYADGEVYYSPKGASQITGTLENALFTKAVLKAIFAYLEDSNNNLIETDDPTSDFGMQFACDSDDGEVYFTYFKVSATNKPGINLQTSEQNAVINPQSVNVTCNTITLANGKKIYKGFADKNSSNYNSYFENIVIPTIPASL